MRSKKQKKTKWIIVCSVGALVAVNTKKGLVMRQMEFDTTPYYFRSEQDAIQAVNNDKINRSLEVVETKEW